MRRRRGVAIHSPDRPARLCADQVGIALPFDEAGQGAQAAITLRRFIFRLFGVR